MFFIKSLNTNFTITRRAVNKMKGGKITKVISFIIYYVGGLPWCMFELAKQANQAWQETDGEAGDDTDI